MQVTLLVGTAKGAFVWRSDARRREWQLEGPLFKGWKVTAACRVPGGDTFLGTASDVYGPAIQRSADLAEWRQVDAGPRYDGDSGWTLRQVWTLEGSNGALYAGVDEAGLFHSGDGGTSWQLVEGLSAHPTRPAWYPGAGGLCAHAVLVDRRAPERLWCGISAVGVFHSPDAGRTWEPRNAGVPGVIEDPSHAGIGACVHALAADPGDADAIWRQDHRGMFRTRDGGRSWERIENGLPSSFGFPLAIDARTKALFACPLESDEYRLPIGGRLRIYRSRDGGDSWEALERGLPTAHSYAGVLRRALAVDSLEPCGVYAGTTAGEVFASADGGDSWTRLSATLPRILCVEAFVEA